ncbi:protein POLLENLESS 3-LIKE 2-like [Ananas comosus]|uniref:Protein POLLENLESS 3-LIKE 2 n=1 Tax=Ananas comosus TaxID=4615 RepID=A0A199V3E5_ANACO|nr:protein POLLENLESS 3-LIKE 2-like [Ananas comosus]OAY71607.1 Protein POLLENLESS 3-LIKE 2 [Ananas comosus]
MMQDPWNINLPTSIRPSKSAPCSPVKPIARTRSESFHVTHKIPVGDTPYVKAKKVQLVDKDPEKAIALFWAAINAGDRVDSALKDMAIVMKQQNRAEEAVEAIKSLRNRCSDQAQESLDNILLDLFKRCGRLDDQIALLKHKLQLIQQGLAFNGKRTKTARSQGKKFQVSVEQEATRLLGNLGWALMQKENYVEAELAYRKALLIGSDNNKKCNLGICLMKQGRIAEAKETLRQVTPAVIDSLRGPDSHLKAFERAQEMLRDLETKLVGRPGPAWLFDTSFLGSSSIWQPQPCIDYLLPPRPAAQFADENITAAAAAAEVAKFSSIQNNTMMLNVGARPFYSTQTMKEINGAHGQLNDPLGNLKRTRSGNGAEKTEEEAAGRRKSSSGEDKWPELPDNTAFEEAIVAAALAPVLEDENSENNNNNNNSNNNNTKEGDGKSPALCEGKMGKRLRIFEDITTQALNCLK